MATRPPVGWRSTTECARASASIGEYSESIVQTHLPHPNPPFIDIGAPPFATGRFFQRPATLGSPSWAADAVAWHDDRPQCWGGVAADSNGRHWRRALSLSLTIQKEYPTAIACHVCFLITRPIFTRFFSALLPFYMCWSGDTHARRQKTLSLSPKTWLHRFPWLLSSLCLYIIALWMASLSGWLTPGLPSSCVSWTLLLSFYFSFFSYWTPFFVVFKKCANCLLCINRSDCSWKQCNCRRNPWHSWEGEERDARTQRPTGRLHRAGRSADFPRR